MLKCRSIFAGFLVLLFAVMSQAAKADYILTADSALGTQSARESKDVPEAWILQRRDEGLSITSVSFRNGLWTVVMSQNTGFTGQAYIVADAIPYAWMNEKQADHYFVTSVASKDDRMMVVMSRGADFAAQRMPNRTMFALPGEAEGYRLTAMGRNDGKFLSVESTGSGITAQIAASRNEFPGDFISDNWKNGFRITSLFYSGGWFVVMSRTDGPLRDEQYVTPDKLQAELDKGWRIKLSY